MNSRTIDQKYFAYRERFPSKPIHKSMIPPAKYFTTCWVHPGRHKSYSADLSTSNGNPSLQESVLILLSQLVITLSQTY